MRSGWAEELAISRDIPATADSMSPQTVMKRSLPCRDIVGVHTQARPEVLLQTISLFSREAIRQLDPSMLYKVIDLLLRKLVLLFCVRHVVYFQS